MSTLSLDSFLSMDPAARMLQISLLVGATILLYLLFFTLKDVMQRSRSVVFQLSSLVIVAGLPGVGFLLYLLFRPSRTLAEKEMTKMLHTLLERTQPHKDNNKKK